MKIVALLLLVGGLVLFLGRLASTPGASSTAIQESGPTRVSKTEESQNAPRQQPKPEDISIEITEAELTRRLSQDLVGRSLGQTPLGNPTLERVEVRLRDGRAGTSGTAQLGGASVPFTSSLSARPDGSGRVKVSVTDAKVSGVPVPEAARIEFEELAQREIDRLLSQTPMRIRSIEIGEGRFRAIGAPAL